MDLSADKYDLLADGFAERTWANLRFEMQRRLALSITWGSRLNAADSVLEFGCGDGYLAQLFVKSGLSYRGMDRSPKMIVMAERRLMAVGLKARFEVSDVSDLSLTEPVDAIVSYMGTFFTFVQEPLTLLRRVRPRIRKKIILDLNPRGRIDLASAIAVLQAAGFRKVTWRPVFVPTSVKLPDFALRALTLSEEIPLVRNLPIRWKFNILLKGEGYFEG
jgi:SAM-dependent methyltransferase